MKLAEFFDFEPSLNALRKNLQRYCKQLKELKKYKWKKYELEKVVEMGKTELERFPFTGY